MRFKARLQKGCVFILMCDNKAITDENESIREALTLTKDTVQAMIDKTEKNIGILTDMVESMETDRFRLYSILQAMTVYDNRF